MIFDLVFKSLLLVTQLPEFWGPNRLCFLVEDRDEFVEKNEEVFTTLQTGVAKFASCDR